jgi:hypothetical protein
MNATMAPLPPDQLERLAHKRAAAKLGGTCTRWCTCVVNLFLFALSSHGFGSRPWSVFPLLGWGLGTGAARRGGVPPRRGQRLRDRMLERERERLRREQERLPRP